MMPSASRWPSTGSRSVSANASSGPAPDLAAGVGGGGVGRLPAALTDFDDTAAVQNVAELLLHRFGHPRWQEVRQRFREGELSLKDYQEITFRQMRAGKAEMEAYVRANAGFRPGFVDLCEFCRGNGIPVAIVSQGLDFYVQALLDASGQSDVPVYAVTTRFDDGGRIAGYGYDFPYPEAPERGNSKALLVRRFQRRGHYVFYAGDGRSDFEAGEVADAVFAHRQMAELCDAGGVAYIPFTDFVPVLAAVREYYGGIGRATG